MEIYIVDRIEDGIAVLECEDCSHKSLPVSEFLMPVAEGDVVVKNEAGYAADPERTRLRREKLAARTKKLFGK